MLHTILVSTRNFVTARPRNNIFALLPCLREKKRKRSSCLFVPKRARKRKKGNCFDKDWADKLAASDKGSYYMQHEFEEGQDLEAAAMVSSSHMKLLSKTMQGSDDDDDVNESEEFNGERRGDENWQTLRGKTIVSGETLVENLDWAVACRVCHADVTLLDNLNCKSGLGSTWKISCSNEECPSGICPGYLFPLFRFFRHC